MPKDNENYPDLMKIPDKVIIKQLRIELGICHAEIDELTFKLESNTPLNTEIGLSKRALIRENQSLKIKIDALTNVTRKLSNELDKLKC